MDELYTMEGPRQMPVLPKICGVAERVFRACGCRRFEPLQSYTHGATGRLRLSSCNFGALPASNLV